MTDYCEKRDNEKPFNNEKRPIIALILCIVGYALIGISVLIFKAMFESIATLFIGLLALGSFGMSSIVVPIVGVVVAIKYLKNRDKANKKSGTIISVISIILGALPIIISTIYMISLIIRS